MSDFEIPGLGTGGSGVIDGDKGDITASGLGNTWTIDPNVVSNSKLAQMATKTYKGRTSALTGNAEDVSVATLKTDLVLVKSDVGLGSVDNTADTAKPVSTAQQTALNLKEDVANKSTSTALGTSDTLYPTQNAVKVYTDTAITAAAVGLLDDRGNYDASPNTFPATGGSGSAGAILKGDLWTVSVAGTLGGVAVTAGDVVRSLIDTPGQTSSNWAIAENNLGYVAENSANKSTTTTLGTSNTLYPTQNAVKTYVDTQDALKESSITATTSADFWSGAKTFINFATTVRGTVITGLSLVSTTVISATDTVLVALGSLQAQITAYAAAIATFTNKRMQPRTASSTTTSNLSPSLSTANVYFRTTQTATLTIDAPIGTPVIGETIMIYVDSAGAQTLTINATYVAFGAAFPATTTAGKTFMMSCQYNGTNWKTLWANAV